MNSPITNSDINIEYFIGDLDRFVNYIISSSYKVQFNDAEKGISDDANYDDADVNDDNDENEYNKNSDDCGNTTTNKITTSYSNSVTTDNA